MAKQFSDIVKDFAHENKKFLIIAADPKTNQVFCGYGDKMVLAELKDKYGQSWPIVRSMLSKTRFATGIDIFLGWIITALEVPSYAFKQFLQFIDGAIFNITGHNLLTRAKSVIIKTN